MSASMDEHPERHLKKLPDRGDGVFQKRFDLEIVRDLDENLGLRELRQKINAHVLIRQEDLKRIYAITRGKQPALDPCDDMPNRYSVFAEHCYGSRSIEITRKFLESGSLRCLLQSYHLTPEEAPYWNADTNYRFQILLACAMSLGCVLPKEMIMMANIILEFGHLESLQRAFPDSQHITRIALAELQTAYLNYTPGRRVIYGQESFVEAATRLILPWSLDGEILVKPYKGPASVTTEEYGFVKLLKIIHPNGAKSVKCLTPPYDDHLYLQAIYSNDVCAACGKKEKEDGRVLDVCSRCQDRRYCSKECQKQHWPLHRVICLYPADEMGKFLASIPLDFVNDVDSYRLALARGLQWGAEVD